MDAHPPDHPPLDCIQPLSAALQDADCTPTLGGSGLLVAHGLPFPVHDWDLIVNADRASVAPVLDGLGCHWHDATDGHPRFPSQKLIVAAPDSSHTIDVMLRFAVLPEGGTTPVSIPSLRDGTWNGLPLGSLLAWLVAYRLMNRPFKPDAIAAYLRIHGIDAAQRDRLLAEPLPDDLRAELHAFPLRP